MLYWGRWSKVFTTLWGLDSGTGSNCSAIPFYLLSLSIRSTAFLISSRLSLLSMISRIALNKYSLVTAISDISSLPFCKRYITFTLRIYYITFCAICQYILRNIFVEYCIIFKRLFCAILLLRNIDFCVILSMRW